MRRVRCNSAVIERASRAQSPRPKHLSQIGRVDYAICVEISGTALARSPATQHDRQIESTDIIVTVKVLRALGVALVQEQAHHPFGVVDERVAVLLKAEHHVVAAALNVDRVDG